APRPGSATVTASVVALNASTPGVFEPTSMPLSTIVLAPLLSVAPAAPSVAVTWVLPLLPPSARSAQTFCSTSGSADGSTPAVIGAANVAVAMPPATAAAWTWVVVLAHSYAPTPPGPVQPVGTSRLARSRPT